MLSDHRKSKAIALTPDELEHIAGRIGTPFYLWQAEEVRRRIETVRSVTEPAGVQARYAMKASSARRVLEEVRTRGLWIDAVSGNEILRALRAGFPAGKEPPVLLYTSDVFRDNALEVLRAHDILPNVGTPQMIEQLHAAGHEGDLGIRVNPGFGHGHVKQCDTGGPSSKHGIWFEDLEAARQLADRRTLRVVLLHAHIGTGPEISEFETNLRRLVDFFLDLLPRFPHLEAVNLGGGIPFTYRPDAPPVRLDACSEILADARRLFNDRAARELRVEVEPGRYLVAPAASLITRVQGLKSTRTNAKGPGQRFILVDAGFADLVRPAMYGSYHHIEIVGRETGTLTPQVVAGPMCESGDVFTRDSNELLDPRPLPAPEIGDLLAIRDAGAYGESMSSNYNSLGRVPQVWYDDGKAFLMSRRQSLEDIVRTECFEEL